MSSKKEIVSQRDIDNAKTVVKQGLKTGLGIGCYNSETDNEIGRSKEHAKHMRRTRRQNFARKMKLIDPHYGKKAAAVLATGTVLGLAATTVPAVGAALGPSVGGAVIAGGLVFLETDAHRAVGDHAILDSLLDDRDDNWRTNTTLNGYDGHGDKISEFDRQQMLLWSDSDSEDDLDNLLPEYMSGGKREKIELSKNSNSSNALFDALGDYGDDNVVAPQVEDLPQDFFSSMESLGLSNSPSTNNSSSAKYSVPRPPSPELSSYAGGGGGQRFTNPHATPTLQKMGTTTNSTPSNQIPDLFASNEPSSKSQQLEDDFFASFSSPPMTPEAVSPNSSFSSNIPNNLGMKINQNKANQTNTTPVQSQPPQSNNGGDDFFAAFPQDSQTSFFSTVASAIPSTSKQNTPQTDNSDPFADLYSRPVSSSSNTKPASNYNALHGMNRF